MKVMITTIPLPIIGTSKVLVYRIEHRKRAEAVIMTHISELEETMLDNDETVEILRGDKLFTLTKSNVYCYGDVDFRNGSDDMKAIDDMNFLNHLEFSGVPIRSDYDYEHHCCNTPNKRCRWTETWSPAVLAKYVHGHLGKPRRIVIFRKML